MIVCDNHPDREAVDSFAVHRFRKVGFRPENATLASTFLDLCDECAYPLGWRPPSPPPGEPGEPMTDPQRRLLFARFNELGLAEDAWRALLEDVTGERSMRALLATDVDRIIQRLDEEEAARG